MANQPLMAFLIIGPDPIFLHKCLDNFQYSPVFLYPQQAVRIFNDIMGAARIKSGYNFSVFIHSKRKLSLVAVPPGLLHSNNWKHGDFFLFKTADPHKVIFNLSLFKRQLLLIFHGLELAAPAGTGRRASWLCPKSRRSDHLHQTGKTIGFFHLHGFRPHLVADDRILDKPDVAVKLSDTGAVLAHIFNGNCKFLIFFHFPYSVVFLMLVSKSLL